MTLLDQWYARIDTVAARGLGGSVDERIADMQNAERLARLTALRSNWEDPALLPFPGGWLPDGSGREPNVFVRPSFGAWGRASELRWSSDYEVDTQDVRETWNTGEANRIAHARWFGDPAVPGPVVVVIHGYRGGGPAEPALWPVRRWRRAGMHVVFPSLPFHGPRAARQEWPMFPSADPRITNEGFRQAVWDLTTLLDWMRTRGMGPVHLAGMSLGGYTAGLLATLIPDLASLLLVVPLASLAQFARQHGRFGEGPVAEALEEALQAVYRPTSPLSRPPRIESSRVQVVGTRGDRITGPEHAERLAAHFGVEARLVSGSHLLQHHLPWGELLSATT